MRQGNWGISLLETVVTLVIVTVVGLIAVPQIASYSPSSPPPSSAKPGTFEAHSRSEKTTLPPPRYTITPPSRSHNDTILPVAPTSGEGENGLAGALVRINEAKGTVGDIIALAKEAEGRMQEMGLAEKAEEPKVEGKREVKRSKVKR